MCGIWAFIQLCKTSGLPNYEQLFADFMKMKARGPDSTDFQIIKNLSVGFHRLAIMEPSIHANQPYIIKDGDRTVVFVCNGEIYDFKELISKYELPIHNNADCMTLVQLYLKYVKHNAYGRNDISRFTELFSHQIKGEYAFLLFEFDRLMNLKEIVMGNDHVGIRPCYVGFEYDETCVGNPTYKNIMFSSELIGMLSFKGKVKKFNPGTIMHYHINDIGRVSYEKEYDFKTIYNIVPMDEKFFKDPEKIEAMLLTNVRNALIASVKRRLVADAPIGFLLSGGLDSGLTSGIASKLLGKPINTFCCGILGTNSTDIKYSKTLATFLKSNHTEVLFTIEEALASIPEVIKILGNHDTTTIRASVGQYMVCKYIGANTDISVIITGELSDEETSGYIYNYYAPDGNALHNAAIEYVQKVHYFDVNRVDRCVAAASCEARIPFSDPEFINAYWTIPKNHRMPSYKSCEKWHLRKAFEGTGIINDEVLWRRKEAFSDGISGTAKSFYEIIQDHIETLISDEEFASNKLQANTKEQLYYRKIFCEIYGEHRLDIIPHTWIPKWDSSGNEVKGYVDPSARTLGAYKKEEQDL